MPPRAPSVEHAARAAWTRIVLACVALTDLVVVGGLALLPFGVAASVALPGLGVAALLASAAAFVGWSVRWRARGIEPEAAATRALSGVAIATFAAWLPIALAVGVHAVA